MGISLLLRSIASTRASWAQTLLRWVLFQGWQVEFSLALDWHKVCTHEHVLVSYAQSSCWQTFKLGLFFHLHITASILLEAHLLWAQAGQSCGESMKNKLPPELPAYSTLVLRKLLYLHKFLQPYGSKTLWIHVGDLQSCWSRLYCKHENQCFPEFQLQWGGGVRCCRCSPVFIGCFFEEIV